jgi:hypothetical protein
MAPSLPPYCGCTLTSVVLMSGRLTPASVSAVMTACWRSLVRFIAVVTSGATNSMLASTVSVSGTPWTFPSPVTVTWRALSATGSVPEPQADVSAAVKLSATTASAERSDSFPLPAMGMTGTLTFVRTADRRAGVLVEAVASPAAVLRVLEDR